MTGRRRPRGILDTCAVIDLPMLDPLRLPVEIAVSSVVLAELAQGVAITRDPVKMMARAQRLADVEAEFAVFPFDREAARRFGTLMALTVRANRNPRPRRLDLMIAATAAANALPLYTRHIDDFKGLESAVEIIGV